jgi:lipopolysaccharide export system protein LptC
MNLNKLENDQNERLTRLSLTRRVVDKSLAYVPMILMGVLAMLSYWLVKNTPEIEISKTRLQQKHEIDYELNLFSVKSYRQDGQLQSLILGERAKHYADTETLEIEMPQLQALDSNLNKTTATSAHAISNADGSELQMVGNAVLIKTQKVDRTTGKNELFELHSEYLNFLMDKDIIKSHMPVQIKKGSSTFSALSMDYDNLNQTLNLKGKVMAHIDSKKQ